MSRITVTTSLPAEWAPFRDLGTLTRLSGDSATALYAVAGDAPRLLRVTGTGLTYDAAGQHVGGAITGLQLIAGAALPGTVLQTISEIRYSGFLADMVSAPNANLLLLDHDTLIGAAGADRLQGGANNDSIDGRAGDDRLDGGTGADTLAGHAGDDALTGGLGNDLLLPGDGRDIVRGGAGNDTVRLTEPEGLNGRAEVFDGGEGEDLLALALPHGALIDLSRAQLIGIEALRFETATRLAVSAESLLALALVEVTYDPAAAGGFAPGFVLSGAGDFILGAFDIPASGADQRLVMQVDGHGAVVFGRGAAQDFGGDVILGGNGASTIFGEGGADSLSAGGGRDLLDGGTGADTLLAGSGAATLYGKEDGDLLLGDVGSYTLLGQGGADTLLGGVGNGHLSGGTGDDLLDGGNRPTTLDGGLGADTIRGGTGNDTYFIRTDDTGDDVILDAGGIDTALVLGGSYTLTGLFEIERLARAGTLMGIGAAESVIGSNFDDSLAGAAGDDTLVGYSGADTLAGGAGNDVYWITSRPGADRISEFGRDAGDRDLIDVSSLTTPDFRVVPVGSPPSGKTVTFETVDGTHSILRGYSYGPSNLIFDIRVDIVGPWTASDFIL